MISSPAVLPRPAGRGKLCLYGVDKDAKTFRSCSFVTSPTRACAAILLGKHMSEQSNLAAPVVASKEKQAAERRPFRVKLRGSVLVLVRLPNKRSSASSDSSTVDDRRRNSSSRSRSTKRWKSN